MIRPGGGLDGIERRLAAFDGTLTVVSPSVRADHRDHGAGLVRVLIAEDHALLRDGLIRLLEAHEFDGRRRQSRTGVAAGAGPGGAREPDVAVVDVRLPPTFTDEGLRAAIEARRQVPGLPILVLSQYVEQLYARELLTGGEGAVGYLLKDRVSNVARLPRVGTTGCRRRHRDGPGGDRPACWPATRPATSPIGRLTPREAEVLGLMAEGRSNAGDRERPRRSPRRRSANTPTTSSPSSTCRRRRTTTAAVMAVLTYLRAADDSRSAAHPSASCGWSPQEALGCTKHSDGTSGGQGERTSSSGIVPSIAAAQEVAGGDRLVAARVRRRRRTTACTPPRSPGRG